MHRYETIEPHEEAHSTFVLKKPVRMNPDGTLKEPSGATSDNFVEITPKADGTSKFDIYINSPYGSFVAFFHALGRALETDEITIFLASGIYSDDARLLLGSMDVCKAPITVHVGYISGFYGACIVAAANKVVTTDSSAISLSTPLEYFTMRGLSCEAEQLRYVRNSIQVYNDLIVESGLATEEEVEEIINKNKHILLKRADLAARLSKNNSV